MAGEIPLILTLDNHGVPHRWVNWQQACFYYAKNLVAWTLGDETFTYYGGICRMTGERSSITAHSIVAIKGKALAAKGFNQVPPLNNRELFRRDRHMCAYCGGEFSYFRLTRDHITPLSRGGRLGQRLEFDATAGGFLDFGGPVGLPDREVVRRRDPRGIRERGLRVRRRGERRADQRYERKLCERELVQLRHRDFLLWRRNHKSLFRIVCKVTTASLCLEFDLDTMLARSLAAKRAAK